MVGAARTLAPMISTISTARVLSYAVHGIS